MSGVLANTPQEIAAAIMVDQGLFGAVGQNWPVYVDDEPDQPDSCATVYGVAGVKDGRSMIEGTVFLHYGFQLRVRGPSQANPATAAKIEAAACALDKLANVGVILDGIGYIVQCFSRQGTVIPLGKLVPSAMFRAFVVNYLMVARSGG